MYFIMNPEKEAFTLNVCCLDMNCGGYAFDFNNGTQDLKFLPYLTPDQLDSEIESFEYSIEVWEEKIKECKDKRLDYSHEEDCLAICTDNLNRLKSNKDKIISGLQAYGKLFFGREFTADEIEELSYYEDDLSREFMVRYLLYNFPFIRKVNDFTELKKDEYGVVYRTGCEDFHFIRYDNGVYSSKRGEDITEFYDEEEGFDENWEEMYYDSESIYFAVKKKEFR